ncbi:hypothetical protein [Xylella phage Xfas53]|nr:hypothetical protein [Xylella phage Xfas53]
MYVNKFETLSYKNEIRRSNSTALMGASFGGMVFFMNAGVMFGMPFVDTMRNTSFSRCIGHLLPVICGGSAEDVGAQLVAANGTVGDTFNDDASLRWHPATSTPIANRALPYTKRCSKRVNTPEFLNSDVNSVHAP